MKAVRKMQDAKKHEGKLDCSCLFSLAPAQLAHPFLLSQTRPFDPFFTFQFTSRFV